VGARFSAPAQTDPRDPDSYIVSTRCLPGVKLSGRGIDHPPPSNTEVTERVEICLYSLWPVLGQTLSLCVYTYICIYIYIQWNLDLSFFKGMEKQNDECGKMINPVNYYTL
jgi:hypothetical protein